MIVITIEVLRDPYYVNGMRRWRKKVDTINPYEARRKAEDEFTVRYPDLPYRVSEVGEWRDGFYQKLHLAGVA